MTCSSRLTYERVFPNNKIFHPTISCLKRPQGPVFDPISVDSCVPLIFVGLDLHTKKCGLRPGRTSHRSFRSAWKLDFALASSHLLARREARANHPVSLHNKRLYCVHFRFLCDIFMALFDLIFDASRQQPMQSLQKRHSSIGLWIFYVSFHLNQQQRQQH